MVTFGRYLQDDKDSGKQTIINFNNISSGKWENDKSVHVCLHLIAYILDISSQNAPQENGRPKISFTKSGIS